MDILTRMKNQKTRDSRTQSPISEGGAKRNQAKLSGCFNFNALCLQYTLLGVTLITAQLLSILLEIEVLGWGSERQDDYAAA